MDTRTIETTAARAQSAAELLAEESVGIEAFRALDRMREALAGQFTGGLSPTAIALAFHDWALHLASSPGKQLELGWKAARKAARLANHVLASSLNAGEPPCIEPLPGDERFAAEAWRKPPFSYSYQAFLLLQQWWHNVTHEVPGVTPHHEEVVSFAVRQMLDVFSPSNIAGANPEIIARTLASGGTNLLRGNGNWLEDACRLACGHPPAGAEAFEVGRHVAITPGKVVFQNHLIELIQYAPATRTVLAEPILIVPAWIMKYYILDLLPENSLVRYLVSRGHTVFCISWRNPDAADRDLSFDDYRRLGVGAALEAINAIVPRRKVHAVGYCLGGTLLSIAAAAMARAGDERLATVTLLASQTDFTQPGELGLFIDHSQLHFLESMMWNRGYLSDDQMAGAFQLLRSNDLIWSRHVREYLLGERRPMSALAAWNADSTRMPYRMHAEYLRRLYIDNELAAGRFVVDGRAAAIQNIRAPLFVVATERDHVAPWRSVYKVHYLCDSEVTFVLTSGGHNAGIVSEPGHPRRHYRLARKREQDPLLSPDEWVKTTLPQPGSWWVPWARWLAQHSSARHVRAPAMGAPRAGLVPLADAPGAYVHQR